MPKKIKGGFMATSMTYDQIQSATKDNIVIENSDILNIYKQNGYSIDDRKKIFSNYLEKQNKNTQSRKKSNSNNVNIVNAPPELDDIITKINGGYDRLVYY